MNNKTMIVIGSLMIVAGLSAYTAGYLLGEELVKKYVGK